MRSFPRTVWLLFLILVLGACTSRPSDDDVRRAIEARLQKAGLSDIMRIEHLERLDGYALNDNVYVVEVKYDLVFTRSFRDLEREAGAASEDAPLSAFLDTMSLIALQMQYGNFKAGDRVTKEESLRFVRAEKGWRILADEQ